MARGIRKVLFAVLAVSVLAPRAHAADQALPALLSESLEVALALSAAPERLRAGAGVHVLRRGGYESVREASNPFACYVVRTVPRFDVQSAATLIPICFDDEGMRAIAPLHFAVARLREEGLSPAAIRARIAAGFASGRFGPPTRAGLSTMISPILNLPDGEGGVWTYPPHFMFYAPGLTNAALDTVPDRGGGWLPWINNEGPHGMLIVPVGEAERERIRKQEATLIRDVEAFLRGQ